MGLGGIVSGVLGLKASKSQSKAASNEIQLLSQIHDDQRADAAPFLEGGRNALAAYNFELGIGDRPVFQNLQATQGEDGTFSVGGQSFADEESANAFISENNSFDYRGFQETPGFQFALDEGNRGLARSAAARGASNGGAFAKDLVRFNQGMANQEYGTFLNRLAGQAGAGQVQLNANAAEGAQFGQSAGNAFAAKGNAKASGFGAINNAFQGTLSQGAQALGFFA